MKLNFKYEFKFADELHNISVKMKTYLSTSKLLFARRTGWLESEVQFILQSFLSHGSPLPFAV